MWRSAGIVWSSSVHSFLDCFQCSNPGGNRLPPDQLGDQLGDLEVKFHFQAELDQLGDQLGDLVELPEAVVDLVELPEAVVDLVELPEAVVDLVELGSKSQISARIAALWEGLRQDPGKTRVLSFDRVPSCALARDLRQARAELLDQVAADVVWINRPDR